MGQRIVFMGTPPFAVASLAALVEAGVDLAAVITAPDRPAGRGQQGRMSAVKEYALSHPILRDRILQPEKLKDPEFHARLDATGASLYVFVAFRMLPEAVWKRPDLGTINLHASLLPDYRGAAPINWAIINGEQRTGVTTFFIRQEIDTGDVIATEGTDIGPDETAGELHDRLMRIGSALIVSSVHRIFNGTVVPMAQNASGALVHTAPKLTPENCRIDWGRTAQQVHDHIRGLSPHPGAWTRLVIGDQPAQHFKILRSKLIPSGVSGTPGATTTHDGRLIVHCANGAIEALDVQAEGKRRMEASSFLRGLRSAPTLRLE